MHKGDAIWWDLHDWQATDSIPAVVGSYPEPFLHGIGGKRYPTTLECGADVAAACKRVTAALTADPRAGASQLIGTGSGPDTLGIVVGTWKEVRSELASELIDARPGRQRRLRPLRRSRRRCAAAARSRPGMWSGRSARARG